MKKIKPIINNKKYIGKYVAMATFNDRKVISSGIKPEDVFARAEAKGFKNPVVFFVPGCGRPSF